MRTILVRDVGLDERAARDLLWGAYGWWAESPDIDRWTAAAPSYAEVRQLAEEGVRFALERDDVIVEHLVPASA